MDLNIPDCECVKDADMKKYATFKTGGKADVLFEPQNTAALCALLKALENEKIKYRVLGNGSNLLVSDDGVREAVIHIGRGMGEIEVQGTSLNCGAGALLSKAAGEAYKHSLTGLEFAHGIPGSVGGAVIMNAGAYGGEMKDVVREIEYVTQNGEIRRISGADAEFSYRHSFFSGKNLIVTRVTMELKEGESEKILEKMKELAERRRAKQPLEYPSAGSTFKRPEGHFAAALIDEAGLKGLSCGGAAVSEKHAGFVINKGGATTSDALKLIDKIKRAVFEKSGVALDTEVEIW
ncbi:MAG: UDP-N-acetylmuramate dehydrogenase [Clostridia bacterium]|nr:UDP-N-acetylmuramate dehydrogenase [Clostridia bacterium]